MMTGAKIVRLAVAFAALSTSSFALAQHHPWLDKPWHEYVYEDDGFAILSPVQPLREERGELTDAGVVEVHIYTMALDWDHSLVVSCTNFGDKMAYKSPERVIEDVRRGTVMAAGRGARVISQHPLTVMGAPGVEVEYVNGSVRYVSRIIYIKGVLFQLVAKSPSDQAFDQERRDFFHSFRLLGKFATPK
jgi:hypothetical protein